MISKELFFNSASECGLSVSPSAFDLFDKYCGILLDYNQKVNLTAIKTPDEVVIKHFIDSLMLTKYCDIHGKKICDVGTGAGFPGVCLLISDSGIDLTLFESIGKKTTFLNFLLSELGLKAEVVNVRAEEAGKRGEYREKFDISTARAVAALNPLAEYCIPLVKTGGIFASLKAPLSAEERNSGIKAAKILGCREPEIISYSIPDGSDREIYLFNKIQPTPAKYPRASAAMAKKEL